MRICKTILSGMILALVFATSAVAQNTNHKVKAGETLFSIAQKYNVSVQQIKQWNNLDGNRLSIGQQLIIKKQAEESDADDGRITHTVKPKETLFSISKRYNVTIDKIKSWNNLQGNLLDVGSTLTLYPDRSENSSSKKNVNVGSGSDYYTVKSGDSLFRVAQLYNMSVEQLKRINNLNSNNIQVGQRLAVQATDRSPSLAKTRVKSSAQGKFTRYELKKSQSRVELLKIFQMDEAEFEALNPGLDATSFRRGDVVNVLAPPTRTFTNPYTTNTGLTTLGTTSATKYRGGANRPTTSGELYNPEALTAAHSNIAMGSVIFIKNESANRGVFVRINDRTTGSGLKLSEAAWEILQMSGSNASVTMYRNNE